MQINAKDILAKLLTADVDVISKLKDEFYKLYKENGCIYEDAYNNLMYNMASNITGEINSWLITSGIPLKKNLTEYQKKVKKVVKNPNVNNIPNKKEAYWGFEEERAQLEEFIERNKDEIPNYKEYLKLVLKTDDKDKIRTIWDKVKQYVTTYANKKEAYWGFEEERKQLEEWIEKNKVDIPKYKELLDRVKKTDDKDKIREYWDYVKRFSSYEKSVAKINDKHFRLFIAKSDEEKIKGLEIFDIIEDFHGMLFDFKNKSNVIFHMGSVKFPIDIIFLLDSPDGLQVEKTIENVIPGDKTKYSANATHVIELNAGQCKKLNIKKGTIVTFLGKK